MLKSICLYSLVLSAFLLLVGCSATGERFHALPNLAPQKGMLMLYRTYQSPNKIDFILRIDNKPVGDLRCNGYRHFSLRPGKHWLQIYGSQIIDYYFDIYSGQYTFIALSDKLASRDFSMGILPSLGRGVALLGRGYITTTSVVPKTIALEQLRQLNYSQQEKKSITENKGQ